MSSTWGEKIKISIFGESHGAAIGVVIDGVPAGEKLDMDRILADMKRRAPGGAKGATARKEPDLPEILSGVKDGIATGSPICAVIRNTDQRSRDYGDILYTPRPSHADFAAYFKYGGAADMRGGGHFSGRLTAPIVFAGSVARGILANRGVTVGAHVASVGGAADERFDLLNVSAAQLNELNVQPFPVISAEAKEKMQAEIENVGADSVGATVECAAVGLPVGLGEPMFGGVEGKVASLLFGVPAVKGIEFGAGFEMSAGRGSEFNDQMTIKNGEPAFLSNNCGGILGGITSGAPLVLRVAFKPTPSISLPQQTFDVRSMTPREITIKGRHDRCIGVRGAVVVECALCLALADMLV